WHWWGKLGPRGGAVVVVRGSGGANERKINIPWVEARTKYQLRACFGDKPLGVFTGKQLQNGALKLALPAIGQEIIEVRPVVPG
ncbi:MAG: hypothetical protein ACXWBP_04765, partial [Limisphaerales bacterium]